MSADEMTLRQLAEDTGLSLRDVHELVAKTVRAIDDFAERYPEFEIHDDAILPEEVLESIKASRRKKRAKRPMTLTLESASKLTREKEERVKKEPEPKAEAEETTAEPQGDKASADAAPADAGSEKPGTDTPAAARPAGQPQDARDRRYSGGDSEEGGISKRKAKKAAKKALRVGGRMQDNLLTQSFEKPVKKQVKEVLIPESITVSELAALMSVKATAVIKELMKLGVMATINHPLDRDTATLVVTEMGHKPVDHDPQSIEDDLMAELEEKAVGAEQSRPPVVTIMGHVDHGKTTLLDTIRKARVAAGEAGGITQHIGAYHVVTDHGMVTFIDTPGHEAFTEMRARGAKSTDIVILIVAADDGVMPQTKEAAQHAQAAGVPIIVAVNKMDKEGADPERIKGELAALDIVPEEWGGQCMFVPISALSGDGIDKLLDAILLQAEVLELAARVEGPAQGVVIESRMTKGRGAVSTVLVQGGQLNVGDMVLAGEEVGRVRSMIDDTGQSIDKIGPAMPVEVIGLSGVAQAGDTFWVVDNERKAREVAEFREHRRKQSRFSKQAGDSMNMFERIRVEEADTINVIIRADVQGSIEAICGSLARLQHDEVKLNIIATNVGPITESDVNLAVASSALLIGFNVKSDATARRQMDNEGIKAEYFSVIYDLIDFIRQLMSGRLAPTFKDELIGKAEVKAVFSSSTSDNIAGCLVVEGTIRAGAVLKVMRNDEKVFEGKVESLRHFTDNVDEVKSGSECGIGLTYTGVAAGDVIECFTRHEVQRQI